MFAAGGFQIGTPSDLAGADMAPSVRTKRLPQLLPTLMFPRPSEGRGVTRDIENLEVAALPSLILAGGAPDEASAGSRQSMRPRLNGFRLSV